VSDSRDQRTRLWFDSSPPIPGVERTNVGEGATSARVLTRTGVRTRRAPVVIFLHAWGPTGVFLYAPWLRHLVGRGATVIFPAYEDASSPTSTALNNMQIGIRVAMKRLAAAPTSVIVAGHTTGATLALDYAATARAAGLPRACAVYGVFPALSLGPHSDLPVVSLAQIPGSTSVTLVAGGSDPVPGGSAIARTLLRGATQIPPSRRVVRQISGENPNGPVEADRAAQATYWRPLDRMIERCGDRYRQTAR
jgi:predicted esterase